MVGGRARHRVVQNVMTRLPAALGENLERAVFDRRLDVTSVDTITFGGLEVRLETLSRESEGHGKIAR